MPGANSTISLQDIVDQALAFGDLAPALATGGFSSQPALSIGNDVMTAMLLGGPTGNPFNWKWNRLNINPFYTNSCQQDYFLPNVVNVGWLESAWDVNIFQTSIPKQKDYLEVHRDLEVTFNETGYPGKICWMQNDTLIAGTWGQTQVASMSGLTNPGPGVVFYNPYGMPAAPNNPTTCVEDAYGNLWVMTAFGPLTPNFISSGPTSVTCGGPYTPYVVNGITYTDPFGPGSYVGQPNPSYPVYQAGAPGGTSTTVASVVTDGTAQWTAINPKGQGMRLNPIPSQTGVTWAVVPVAQMRVPRFTNLQQTLEPIPDDWESYFKAGFFAQCFRRSPDPKVRAKFKDEWELYMTDLDKAMKQGAREIDDFGFYPGDPSVMDTGWGVNPTRPDWPFGPWTG